MPENNFAANAADADAGVQDDTACRCVCEEGYVYVQAGDDIIIAVAAVVVVVVLAVGVVVVTGTLVVVCAAMVAMTPAPRRNKSDEARSKVKAALVRKCALLTNRAKSGANTTLPAPASDDSVRSAWW